MKKIALNTNRFRAADTDAHYDALPNVPARRRGLLDEPPSEAVWWTAPREFAASFRTALATDVLHAQNRWFIVREWLVDALGIASRLPVVLVDYDLERMTKLGALNHEFVAVDVPVLRDRIDQLRSGRNNTTMLCEGEELPALFRLSPFERDVYISDRATCAFERVKGVDLQEVISVPPLDGCAPDMLRIREGAVPESGQGTDQVDSHGFTQLHHAVEVGNIEAARLLLEGGANMNALSLEGISPLGVAAFMGHERCVDLMLEGGANVSAGVRNAAQLAAFSGHAAICLRLLRVDSTAKGASALQVAVQQGHDELVIELLDANVYAPSMLVAPFELAMSRRMTRVLPSFFTLVPFPNKEVDKARLLHGAAHSLCIELIEGVIERGVDVDAVNSLGSTVLKAIAGLAVRLAPRLQTLEVLPVVEVLVRHGADPDRKSTKGNKRSAREEVEAGIEEARQDPYASELEFQGLHRLANLLKHRTVGGT